jgi:hypothetical protein
VRQGRNNFAIISATLALSAGVIALFRGHASWYGAGRIEGAQVIAFSVVCFGFSAVFLYLYLRR